VLLSWLSAAAIQLTRLELLDVAANPPKPDLLQAFPSISHLIIRAGGIGGLHHKKWWYAGSTVA
jgi:hypothetical protein